MPQRIASCAPTNVDPEDVISFQYAGADHGHLPLARRRGLRDCRRCDEVISRMAAGEELESLQAELRSGTGYGKRPRLSKAILTIQRQRHKDADRAERRNKP